MTEWNAAEYARRSSLQEVMAEEVLALLDLQGSEQVLDIGCGDGRITAEIAARLPQGSVVGVDPSHDMIAFAANRSPHSLISASKSPTLAACPSAKPSIWSSRSTRSIGFRSRRPPSDPYVR